MESNPAAVSGVSINIVVPFISRNNEDVVSATVLASGVTTVGHTADWKLIVGAYYLL